jgi:Glycosyl hydrolase family 9
MEIFLTNWGTNKLACGSAFPAALFAKLVQDSVIAETDSLTLDNALKFNRKIIDYMLGTNEFKHPFIHGFKGDMAHKLHHRNAMGQNELSFDAGRKNSSPYMFKSGALIGGPSAEGKFQNIVEGGDAFKETEGGCDYNGPFVAALANIVAEMDPKVSTVYKPVHRTFASPASCSYSNNRIVLSGCKAEFVTVCRIDGSIITSVKMGNNVLLPSGMYIVRLDGRNALTMVVSR